MLHIRGSANCYSSGIGREGWKKLYEQKLKRLEIIVHFEGFKEV